MDLFVFYAQYRVLVCKPCAFAVSPLRLASHIKNRHAREACHDAGIDFSISSSRAQGSAVSLARRLHEKYDILDPSTCKVVLSSPTEPPLLELKLYRGHECSRCTLSLSAIKSARDSMQRQSNQHRLLPRKKGRPQRIQDLPEEDDGPMLTNVHRQRFFASSHQSSFFAVHVPSKARDLKAKSRTSQRNPLQAVLTKQLHARDIGQQLVAQEYSSAAANTEVSLWLEMTWPRYFNGLNVSQQFWVICSGVSGWMQND